MPVFVDHDARRVEIVNAATAVLSEAGFAKFTLRAVGRKMGGSVTLVTHYFPHRDTLMEAMLEQTLSDAEAMQTELAAISDPHERLRATIRYFMPLDETTMTIERARVALTSHLNVEPAVAEHMRQIDPGMRNLVRVAISEFIAPDQLDATVDFIRLWTAGVVLTAVEHPGTWTEQKQTEALEFMLRLMDIPLLVT